MDRGGKADLVNVTHDELRNSVMAKYFSSSGTFTSPHDEDVLGTDTI